MTDRSPADLRIDRTIDAWLHLGPTELADDVIARTRVALHDTPRRRWWWRTWQLAPGSSSTRATSLLVAALAVAVLAVGTRLWTAPGIAGPSPWPTPIPSVEPSVVPSPTIPGNGALPIGGAPVYAGTYSFSAFQPAFSFTVDKVVKLNCAAGAQCHGTVDVNAPGWIGLEFGGADGSEVDFIRLDQVYDANAPTKLIDPPADLVGWVNALPGKAQFAPVQAISVGGLPALQFDVSIPGDKQFGTIPGGFGQAGIGVNGLRITLVTVHGHLVLISEWLGQRNSERDPVAALHSLQPLVDSIAWS